MKSEYQHKSVFGDYFYYLKIPVELLKMNIISRRSNMDELIDKPYCSECPKVKLAKLRLTAAEQLMFAKVLYWTRSGRPCTHSNAQFAELINQDESTARRGIYRLLRHKLLDAFYPTNRDRELTALVSVKAEHVATRKAAQLARSLRTSAQGGAHPCAAKGRFAGHQCAPITNITKEQLSAAPSPSPGKRASAPLDGKGKETKVATAEERQEIAEKHRLYDKLKLPRGDKAAAPTTKGRAEG